MITLNELFKHASIGEYRKNINNYITLIFLKDIMQEPSKRLGIKIMIKIDDIKTYGLFSPKIEQFLVIANPYEFLDIIYC